ncbi:maleylpyruvate isomerase family mycothiol-dependent enzyme [Nonomuraea sp. PA05]|uniref:maleylpyruvate isomerase N-terminal domain-containing protein n=1 Tax=Nonomuraea sp. PA05 TaxID=2604466 RepID=UPI0011D77ACA|nr:maleylpyruvate isomerase N-terminal domain-containing protein [Nonomuraea sp. PA05]TYB70402.1 maleylpyruvate isomerase family mycothiol-dependent enzyme [Nonomuraea sp. PA05]
MTVLPALQAELAAATNQLLATAASLSDADVAAPSLLPGWTRGHVLTHLARNADSYVNLLTWAKTGVRTPQYASREARAAEIEATARRPAARLLADVEDGAARFAAAVRDLPEHAWRAPVQGMRPPPHPAWYVLVRRLREVGFHHVDLGAGFGPGNWPASFVRRELHDCLRTWPPDHGTIGEIVILDRAPGGTGTGGIPPGGAATHGERPGAPSPTGTTGGAAPPSSAAGRASGAASPAGAAGGRPPGAAPPSSAAGVGAPDAAPPAGPASGRAPDAAPPTGALGGEAPGAAGGRAPGVASSAGAGTAEVWPGLGHGPAVTGTPRDLLAWLTGRSGGQGVSLLPAGQSHVPGPGGVDLPEPPPWLSMTAPADLPATPPKDYP